IDGVPIETPAQVLSVEGVIRNIAPNTPQLSNSISYVFDSWSNGGGATQSITTPVNDTNLVANYNISYRFADNPTNIVNGLYYKFYPGNWTAIPDFNTLTPNKEGIISIFDYSPRTLSDYFGFRFNGYIDVPTDSIYTFYTSSDDGSKLYIGNILVVDNDGVHPMQERSGSIGLKAGKHAITVDYFERNGGQVFSVSWQGPGISKQIIPAASLYRLAGPVNTIAIADAYTRSGSFKNNCLGQTDAARLYSKYAESISDQCRETYLLFDISKFTNEFTSASLDVFGKLKGVDLSSAAEISCLPVANTFWTENTITFANKPTASSNVLAVAYIDDANGKYYSFDVSNHLKQLLNDGYTQAAFTLKGNFVQNNYVIWNSKESAGNNKPKITCNYLSPRQVSSIIQSNTGIEVFPNPVSGNLITIGVEHYPADIFVFDLQGKLLLKEKIDSDLMQLPIDKLTNGIYLIQALSKSGIATQKLQVIND
ncbi:MAG TPA: DNRLRE domain-containing protein, partial [Bacteroidia bacterium]|nr:DNRLRE domain-containing protein [Bacteroidia bacterium]